MGTPGTVRRTSPLVTDSAWISPLPFRDISVAHVIEDRPERLHHASHVWLADEDRIRTIEVLDVVGVVPLVGGGVRRGSGMAIQDELSLRPHPVIYSHVYLPYSDTGLDGMADTLNTIRKVSSVSDTGSRAWEPDKLLALALFTAI